MKIFAIIMLFYLAANAFKEAKAEEYNYKQLQKHMATKQKELDKDYQVPNYYNEKYYKQEPEAMIEYHNPKRIAQDEKSTYTQEYYYY